MGFAYINDVCYYHTQYDDPAHLDPRSLQQEGDYALALARRFGSLDLRHMRAPDATYFVLPLLGVVVYPISWSLPLAIAAALFLAATVTLGIARRRLSLGGVLAGFVGCLLLLAIASAAVQAMWSLVRNHDAGVWQAFAGDPYHADVYRLASVALAIAIGTGVYALIARRARVLNLWAGVLLGWLLLVLATGILMPGATYLFLWPLLAATAALALLVVRGRQPGDSAGSLLLVLASAVPALVLMAPSIELLFMSLTMRMAFTGAFATVLLLGLLIPCVDVMARVGRWWLPGAAASVCAGCLVVGAFLAGPNRDLPRTDSIYYGMDADTGKAVWFSLDEHEDDWTAHYLGANPQRAALPQFVPFMSWQYLTHAAPAVPLAAPRLDRVEDTVAGAVRTLRLRVTSPRHAPRLYIYGDERAPVLEASVDGVPIDASQAYFGLKPGQKTYAFRMRRWGLCYFNVPAQGLDLRLRLAAPAAGYRMEVVDQSYGIDGMPGVAPRPDDLIPFPIMMDSVWVRKAYTF